MMNNPTWWDSDITIYNKYIDPVTNIVIWHRTNLSNCFFKRVTSKIMVGNTLINGDNTIIRIPENSSFKPKDEWLLIPNDQMSNFFTLSIGDIIIQGSVSDVINEYTNGTRSTDILKKYANSGAITIDSVTVNTNNGVMFNRHYLVKGV